MTLRKLILDIETAPNTAYVWGLFKETVPLARLIETGYVLCWAAKWHGEDEVMFDSVYHSSRKKMLKRIHKLLSNADAVIHFNGKSFDIPSLNREFLEDGMPPPSPYKQIDILQIVRASFRFTSNKLDHVARQLGCGQKHDTTFELWVECMHNDPKAWKKMEAYNRQDVLVLEKVYEKVLPWINRHPNHGLYDEPGVPVCSNCGGTHLQRRGYARTAVAKYARYQCLGCGAWNRGTDHELPKEDRGRILRRDNG